jgi:hypothetical protein
LVIGNLEFGSKLSGIPFTDFKLKDKESGAEQTFNKYKEDELATIRNNAEIT